MASIEDTLFDVSNVLRVPVLVASLLALAVALAEAGALAVELWHRRGRRSLNLQAAARGARNALEVGDPVRAAQHLTAAGSSVAMGDALGQLVTTSAAGPGASSWMAKTIADFDLQRVRRLERTRVLVRIGP